MRIDRRGNSSLSKWWWCIDHVSLILIFSIICIGALLITTASPAVADRLNIGSFYFVHRQFAYLILGVASIIFISSLSEKNIRRFVLLGFIASLVLMVLVLVVGDEAKGAKRWISLLGVSIQPSEFMKPFYIVITGLLLSEKYNKDNFPGFSICIVLHFVIVGLLVLQPDFGMTVTTTAVLAGQFFLAGLSIFWIVVAGLVAIVGAFIAYMFMPHVAKRINSFLNPETSENYQVEKSLEAYVNGGFFGKGPGEGTVKAHLPDSHCDFIFAVAGEELGAIFCVIIVCLFFAIVARGIVKLSQENNLFTIYVCGGMLMLFAMQSIFNIGVTLHLFPAKGMTLPFISYGGSSVLSFAIAFGIFLNLTKKRYGATISHERTHYHK